MRYPRALGDMLSIILSVVVVQWTGQNVLLVRNARQKTDIRKLHLRKITPMFHLLLLLFVICTLCGREQEN